MLLQAMNQRVLRSPARRTAGTTTILLVRVGSDLVLWFNLRSLIIEVIFCHPVNRACSDAAEEPHLSHDQFSKLRKQHYHMAEEMKKARELLAKELAELEED